MKITVYVGEEFVDEVKGRSSVYIKRLNNGSFYKFPAYLLKDKH